MANKSTFITNRELDAEIREAVRGSIDISYQTQQRDMFASGLASRIGVYAYTVWSAIKFHSDFNTGGCWPGIRRLCSLTGICDQKLQESIRVLESAYLLRVIKKRGRTNHYVARERMDVRVGNRIVCSVVVDYIPAQMRQKLEMLKGAARGEVGKEDVWAQVEIIPGEGMRLDQVTGTFKTEMRADEITDGALTVDAHLQLNHTLEAKQKLKELADEMRTNIRGSMVKK